MGVSDFGCDCVGMVSVNFDIGGVVVLEEKIVLINFDVVCSECIVYFGGDDVVE